MSRHLISTPATPSRCRRCRATTLTGHDRGLPATVNPTPINPTDEPATILAGARTYTRINTGELVHRDATQIRGQQLTGPIHAEHQCPKGQ